MDSGELSKLYDAYYYAHDCGRPYQRDEEWLSFFANIAERIVSEIGPKTVLDAGCAWGFLVEGLRKRKVEAFGVDISEYAIEHVHADIQPYCKVASVTEPFERKYDLIVCIEVLEHMPVREAEAAIVNFCKFSDDIIFSSTPFDYKEVTHVNVHAPEYWAGLFARQGFYRDFDFDASFITPWAVRYVRKSFQAHRFVKDYERRFFLLWKENVDLREMSVGVQAQLKQQEGLVEVKQAELDVSNERLAQTEKVLLEREKALADQEVQHQEAVKEKEQEKQQVLEVKEAEFRQKLAEHKQALEQNRLIMIRQAYDLEEKKNSFFWQEQQKKSLQADLDFYQGEAVSLRQALDSVEDSETWRLMMALGRVRIKLFPPGSWRARLLSGLAKPIKALAKGLLKPAQASKPSHPAGHGQSEATAKLQPVDLEYQDWISENEPNSAVLKDQMEKARGLEYQPLISVVTPVYNTDPEILRQAIRSVLVQTYANWELCLADGGSDMPATQSTLEEMSAADERIKLVRLEENPGISGNTNKAVALAEGDFLAFLDHDDTLAPSALFEVVSALNEDREADVIYSDHDILSADGKLRHNPLFKPNWSPEILYSSNYITHLLVIRTKIFNELGGLDSQMDGAQDWDMLLRLSEQTQKICHIPKVLYHWRETENSTAGDIFKKPFAVKAQLKTLKAHLRRLGLKAPVAFFDKTGFIRVGWKPEKKLKVSIIIPSRGADEKLKTCVDSILSKTSYSDYEVLILNNGDKKPEEFSYYKKVSRDERVSVLHYDKPFNYSAINNYGAEQAKGDLLLFLNDDTVIINEDWLDEMAMWASRPEIGAVGARLIYSDHSIQHAGVILGLTGFAGHIFNGMPANEFTKFGIPMWYRNYLAVTGACVMTRRKVLQEVGGWPEDLGLCGNDVVLGMRINEAGYRVVYNPFISLFHEESATHQGSIPAEDFRTSYIYYRKVLQEGDPFYNPNLSLWYTRPMLKRKGEQSALSFVKDYIEKLGL